jgi:hypothetical protein
MEFNIEEDNKNKLEETFKTTLPTEEEIIILEDGILIIDEENPLAIEDLGKTIGDPILCGC